MCEGCDDVEHCRSIGTHRQNLKQDLLLLGRGARAASIYRDRPVDMSRVGNLRTTCMTAAGCIQRTWTQEFASSPAHSASTVVLGLLRS